METLVLGPGKVLAWDTLGARWNLSDLSNIWLILEQRRWRGSNLDHAPLDSLWPLGRCRSQRVYRNDDQ